MQKTESSQPCSHPTGNQARRKPYPAPQPFPKPKTPPEPPELFDFDEKNRIFTPPVDYTNQKNAGIMSAQAMSSAQKGRECAAPCLHEGDTLPSFLHRAKPVNEMERSGIECTASYRYRSPQKREAHERDRAKQNQASLRPTATDPPKKTQFPRKKGDPSHESK